MASIASGQGASVNVVAEIARHGQLTRRSEQLSSRTAGLSQRVYDAIL